MQKQMLHYSVNSKGSPSSCGLIIGLTLQSIGHSLFRFMFKIHRLPLIPDDRFILNFCEVSPILSAQDYFLDLPTLLLTENYQQDYIFQLIYMNTNAKL